jgi:hypothetical protein
VLGERLESVTEKVPAPEPFDDLDPAIVGLGLVDQQIPLTAFNKFNRLVMVALTVVLFAVIWVGEAIVISIRSPLSDNGSEYLVQPAK